MNQSAFQLYSWCGVSLLACDHCDTLETLKNTFVDAYKYYVGRKPRVNTIDKFMNKHKVIAYNGVEYSFEY